ncbi:fumarylacetoacetate hydrolase family protein [Congregibacter sp.]|uniref:fumarylacetoacetate hydrolase family protein n=1 Tax=Congregibacter sp. TaxID=2744308 RepID=UPI00385C93FF
MKLRRVIKGDTRRVQAYSNGYWVSVDRVEGFASTAAGRSMTPRGDDELLGILNLDKKTRESLQAKLDQLEPEQDEDSKPILPFHPASFRDFMLYEKHVVDSTRGYVKRFIPHLYPITQLVEKLSGKPFPRFRPHALWYKQPIYYLSNHLNFKVSGDEVSWPSYTKALDYELEIGAVITKPLFNASTEEAAAAIGGFVVLNDVSARDVQKDEMESGFGPQKAKHFVSTMSAVVVSADEVQDQLESLVATISINGNEVAECNTRGMHFEIAEAVAFASKDEQLHPGELFGSGTIPGGTGMENDHWLAPGDTVSLRIHGIGEVTNTMGDAG